MSISIPDEKMDDYARDCVVRLANRVDDKVLRERLLQMAREWKAAAMDEGNRALALQVMAKPVARCGGCGPHQARRADD
jgi:hypothetical protein